MTAPDYRKFCFTAALVAGLSAPQVHAGGMFEDIIDDISLNLSSEYLFEGSYAGSYETLAGGGIRYDLSDLLDTPDSNAWRHHLTASYHTAVDGEGSELNLFSAGIGSSYDVTTVYGKPLFVDYTIGAVYSSETFSSRLIDRTAKTTFSSTDYLLSLGTGMRFTGSISSRLYVSRFGDNGTSAGLSLSVEF